MKEIIVFIFLIIIIQPLFSKDKIITKDGKEIKCKIISEDSIKVYFKMKYNGYETSTMFDKKEIKSIIYSHRKKSETFTEQDYFEKDGMRNRIAINGGPSFSVGDFGKKDIKNDESGLANNGANFNIFFTHKFASEIGLGVKVFYNYNRMDSKGIEELFNYTYNKTFNTESSSWSSWGFMGGIQLFHQSYNFEYELRVMAGYINLTSPELTLKLQGTNFWIKQESLTPYSLGYDVGISSHYFLSDEFILKANLDFIGSKFKFDKVQIKAYDGTSITGDGGDQKFNVINFTFGIGYNF